jgi:predicted O-linked N-acetylglucosamine transferase (SPINDLY family)
MPLTEAALQNDLGNTLCGSGDFVAASTHYGRAIELNPCMPETWNNLGNALRALGELNESLICYRESLRLNGESADTFNNLALAHREAGDLDKAVECFRAALQRRPDFAEAWNNFGTTLIRQKLWDDGLSCLTKSVRCRPDYPEALNNLGSALCGLGFFEDGISCFRNALALRPQYHQAASNLLLCLHYVPSLDPAQIFHEHARWGASRRSSEAVQVHTPRRPGRIRIGYVSPDFRAHAVAYLFEALLIGHDRIDFQLYFYSDVARHDEVTLRFQDIAGRAGDTWRDTARVRDAQLSELIVSDGIDILVDLAGHSAGNRLSVFAGRLAPVQVTYLGYPDTTGLDTVDYRITDAIANPPGLTEALYTEELVRLQSGFLCYTPPAYAPAVSSRESGSPLTFGAFHNFSKINPESIALWSRILNALPESRMVLKDGAFASQTVCDRVRALFADGGIAPQRLTMLGSSPHADHLCAYSQIDIALDSAPYNGTTTTLEALWMGVPVIVLAGLTHVSRVGASICAQLGRPDWVAASADEYVEKALALARDPERRRFLRGRLRWMMQGSALCDASTVVQSLELAYRKMWRRQ